MRYFSFLCLISIAFIACETKHTKPIHHIDYSKIEEITIKANPKLVPVENHDSVRVIPLDKAEIAIAKINASISTGKITFMPRYTLYISFEDDSKREFTLTGDIIKETLEEVQEIRIANYSDSLWAMGLKK